MRGATPSLLFAPDLGAPGTTLALSREEAHYVARVCRAREGDFAEATDGRGTVARLLLRSVAREVRAEVVSVERRDRSFRTWLLCGAPERGRVKTRLAEYPDPEKAYREMASTQHNGRMAQPEEIAAAALYLAADESAMVTGSNLMIDGGWSAGK